MAAILAIHAALGPFGPGRQRGKRQRHRSSENLYIDLLAEWSDALCELQVNQIKHEGIHGGILCPECSRIATAAGTDAVYPLLAMAHLTGKDKYLDAAVKLQRWSLHMNRPNSSFHNEPTGNDWRGITVFGAIALAESLRRHGTLLDAKTPPQWEKQLRRPPGISSSHTFLWHSAT